MDWTSTFHLFATVCYAGIHFHCLLHFIPAIKCTAHAFYHSLLTCLSISAFLSVGLQFRVVVCLRSHLPTHFTRYLPSTPLPCAGRFSLTRSDSRVCTFSFLASPHLYTYASSIHMVLAHAFFLTRHRYYVVIHHLGIRCTFSRCRSVCDGLPAHRCPQTHLPFFSVSPFTVFTIFCVHILTRHGLFVDISHTVVSLVR